MHPVEVIRSSRASNPGRPLADSGLILWAHYGTVEGELQLVSGMNMKYLLSQPMCAYINPTAIIYFRQGFSRGYKD